MITWFYENEIYYGGHLGYVTVPNVAGRYGFLAKSFYKIVTQ